MRGFWAAWRFLTIIPLPGKVGTDEDSLTRSLPFFPLIGVLIGLLMSRTAFLAWHLLPSTAAAVVLTFAMAAISGGFHLDGLADSADGLFSARPKEKILTIMRDSRIGAMGVIALLMIVLLKISCLAAMNLKQAMLTAFLMPLAGRAVMVINMALVSYIRKEGAASLFYNDKAKLRRTALWSGGVLYAGAWYSGGVHALIAAAAALLIALLWIGYCRVKIGGATGDTLGACCEITEMAVALVMVM
jgi:adenosylcobinamide-GDP ribazoletransferase